MSTNNSLPEKVTLAQNLSERNLGDEIVVVKAGSDEIHTFRETGMEIWKMLAEGKNTVEIISALMKDYGVEEEVLVDDLKIFLEDCRSKKLID